MRKYKTLIYLGPSDEYFKTNNIYPVVVSDLLNLKCIRLYDTSYNLIALQILNNNDYTKYWKQHKIHL